MEIELRTIPELDTAQVRGGRWTANEMYILERYCGRANWHDIMKHLPGRTMHAAQNKAYQMGLTHRRE